MVAHPSMQGGYGSSPVIPQIRPHLPRFPGAIATDAGRELAGKKSTKQMKIVTVFGVEMTSLEEMMFAKHISNNGIAMNTFYPEQRTNLTSVWIEKYRMSKM